MTNSINQTNPSTMKCPICDKPGVFDPEYYDYWCYGDKTAVIFNKDYFCAITNGIFFIYNVKNPGAQRFLLSEDKAVILGGKDKSEAVKQYKKLLLLL